MLLLDKEWVRWSDRKIARQAKVSNRFVSNIRHELTVNVHSEPSRLCGTTGLVARRLGRDFVGIELSGDYWQIADLRRQDAQ